MKTIVFCAALLMVAGCSASPAENAAANVSGVADLADADVTEVTDESVVQNAVDEGDEGGSPIDGWSGTWLGIEGLVLVIAPGTNAETRKLTITLLDGTKTYLGTVRDDTIVFDRGDRAETIRAGSGAETGLKYLAAKQNCLIIKAGEGFCRL